ncbi:MAG: hypothetical protein IJ272_00270 [Clostridia bacterium]|nr:hypothetical protein [Clostridia bacterium]
MRYNNSPITKGEIIIVCIALVIWTTICVFINMAISNAVSKSNEVYYKAIQIDNDAEMFEYAMRTNAGNALVYGTVSCSDPVSTDMLNGQYLAVRVDVDRYERNVTYEDITDEEGNVIGQREVVSYDWENYKTSTSHAGTINFLGQEFPYSKLNISNYTSLSLNSSNVKDEWTGDIRMGYIYPDGRFYHSVGDLRYSFDVIPLEQNVTVLADLRDSTIFNVNSQNGGATLHYNTTIPEVIKSIESSKYAGNILFSIVWYVLFGFIAYLFVNERNRWADC